LENQKGYHYLDLSSNRLIISHHVSFDESSFPFAEKSDPIPSSNFDFLLEFNVIPSPIRSYFSSCVSTCTGSPSIGSSLVVATPGSSARLPKEVGSVGATPGSSVHLPKEVGPVVAAHAIA
jgi:hypothetical protein